MSNVPVGKRKVAATEFEYRAMQLHSVLYQLLCRDFGIKAINRELRAFVYSAKMERQDRIDFTALCDKYRIAVEAEYPSWQIERYRNKIMTLADEMLDNIKVANTVYATSENEFYFRRQYQWKAIANCRQLLQQLQLAMFDLHLDAQKLMPVTELIEREYELLKNWKKSDNRILEHIRQKNKQG